MNLLLPGVLAAPGLRAAPQRERLGFMSTIRDAIIEAVKRDGRSLADLSRASGVPRPSISDFIRAKRTATVETIDRLMPVLGLAIEARAPRRKKKAPASKKETGAGGEEARVNGATPEAAA